MTSNITKQFSSYENWEKLYSKVFDPHIPIPSKINDISNFLDDKHSFGNLFDQTSGALYTILQDPEVRNHILKNEKLLNQLLNFKKICLENKINFPLAIVLNTLQSDPKLIDEGDVEIMNSMEYFFNNLESHQIGVNIPTIRVIHSFFEPLQDNHFYRSIFAKLVSEYKNFYIDLCFSRRVILFDILTRYEYQQNEEVILFIIQDLFQNAKEANFAEFMDFCLVVDRLKWRIPEEYIKILEEISVKFIANNPETNGFQVIFKLHSFHPSNKLFNDFLPMILNCLSDFEPTQQFDMITIFVSKCQLSENEWDQIEQLLFPRMPFLNEFQKIELYFLLKNVSLKLKKIDFGGLEKEVFRETFGASMSFEQWKKVVISAIRCRFLTKNEQTYWFEKSRKVFDKSPVNFDVFFKNVTSHLNSR